MSRLAEAYEPTQYEREISSISYQIEAAKRKGNRKAMNDLRRHLERIERRHVCSK